ncbi:unnamed protein product, partial [Ectocarpus sp. 12 AP-2014]
TLRLWSSDGRAAASLGGEIVLFGQTTWATPWASRPSLRERFESRGKLESLEHWWVLLNVLSSGRGCCVHAWRELLSCGGYCGSQGEREGVGGGPFMRWELLSKNII